MCSLPGTSCGRSAAGVFAKKKMDASRNEQALWQQATDPVDKA